RRIVSERLHLSIAARSFGERTAPIVLPVVPETNPVASEHPARQLAFFTRTLRELRQPDRFPLFRGGTSHRAAFPRCLASVSMGGGACLLGLRFPPRRRHVH